MTEIAAFRVVLRNVAKRYAVSRAAGRRQGLVVRHGLRRRVTSRHPCSGCCGYCGTVAV
jgi:hypothetical protein